MAKYVGVARDTLDLGDVVIEIERGALYTDLPEHQEVQRAIAAGTLQEDLSGEKPTPSQETPEAKPERRGPKAKPEVISGD